MLALSWVSIICSPLLVTSMVTNFAAVWIKSHWFQWAEDNLRVAMKCFVGVSSVLEQGIAFWIHSAYSEVSPFMSQKSWGSLEDQRRWWERWPAPPPLWWNHTGTGDPSWKSCPTVELWHSNFHSFESGEGLPISPKSKCQSITNTQWRLELRWNAFQAAALESQGQVGWINKGSLVFKTTELPEL